MIFNVDFLRLILQLLPTFFRQPIIFGILRAAYTPLEDVYNDFIESRKERLYRLSHNSQVCYLQAALNDSFTSSVGKFEIMTVEKEGSWFFARTETGENVPLTSTETGGVVPTLYNELSLNAEQNDFVISVPSDIYQTSLKEVKAIVDRYKLPSKHAIYIQKS